MVLQRPSSIRVKVKCVNQLQRDETRCSAICFAQLSQIPPNILEQLEKFDYSQDVPKLLYLIMRRVEN